MSQADFTLARRIYSLSTSFYFFMYYMVLAAVEALLAFLLSERIAALRSLSSFISHHVTLLAILSDVSAALSVLVLVLSPFVLVYVWRVWGSLSRWRRSFLRFSLVANIESVAFEARNPQEKLLQAFMAVNPEYETLLLQSRDAAKMMGLFKGVTITHRGRSATFDVLIGLPLKRMKEASTTIDSAARWLPKTGAVADLLRELSEIGTSVGRIVEGRPTVNDYKKFSEDVKLLSSYADSRIVRAFLVSTEPPGEEVVGYANDKRNWPRYELTHFPITLVVQEENGYQIVVAN